MMQIALPAGMQMSPRFSRLPGAFFSQVNPEPLPMPRLLAFNAELATSLGMPADCSGEMLAWLSGNATLPTYPPLASVYAGHQFGVFVPQLGDGRALLVAELLDQKGIVQEIQLKGSGITPYSRMGDGRAVLRSCVREYLCSEAMHALGIPTTRALALIGSPYTVWREAQETTAVVTRVAPSFLRFGHFEYFSYRRQYGELKALLDFALTHFYPECISQPAPYAALLTEVVKRTAKLIVQWLAVGFCHGVMNTDNMSLLGLTIDYGPYGFMDGFDAAHICNHSDTGGRYAYNQQSSVGLWNLQRLAVALSPLIEHDLLHEALAQYQPSLNTALENAFQAKLGLDSWQADDWPLFEALVQCLHASRADWTLFWRRLSHYDPAEPDADKPLLDLFVDRATIAGWLQQYRARLIAEQSRTAARLSRMQRCNPKYVLRNYLAEQAIRALSEHDDPGEMHRLLTCLAQPFAEQPEFEVYTALPPDWASTLSVSCSS